MRRRNIVKKAVEDDPEDFEADVDSMDTEE
jgi:hypothetical protein